MADDTGDLLVRSGLVSSGALEEARQQVDALGGTLGEQLVENDAINDDDLTEFYAQSLQVPRIRASALARIPAAVIDLIPRDMAIALRAIPISRSRDNRLTVAMSDPTDDYAAQQLSTLTKWHVVRAVATQMQIAWCLAHYYEHMTQLGRRLLQVNSDTRPLRRAQTADHASAARMRTASGEIRVATLEAQPDLSPLDASAPESSPRSPSETAPSDDVDKSPTKVKTRAVGRSGDASGPIGAATPRLVVEVHPSGADDDTAKIVARRRKREALPQPPELAARTGEVDLKPGPEPQVTSGPTIVVELGPDVGPVETGYVASDSLRTHRTQLSEYADEEPTAPMWFERKSSEDTTEPTKPGFGPNPDAQIPDDSTPRPTRVQRTTQIGVPVGPGGHRAARRGARSGGKSPRRAETSRDIPDRVSDDGERIANRIDIDQADPEWGRPGATIPPALRGDTAAVEEPESDAIPLPSLDAPPIMLATTSVTERSRPHSRAESGIARALEDTTQRVLTLIHHLEAATDRDAVVAAMVNHLAECHQRAGLFIARNNELSLFSIEPRTGDKSVATLRLDRPSTLRDVVDSRLPYRGPMHDPDSRAYLQAVLGACPAEILLVPVAVRDRVVGVLFGEHRIRPTFDDQLALAARAAGMALERILKVKRG